MDFAPAAPLGVRRVPAVLLLLAFLPAAARAQGDPNACDEAGESPNVIVGDLHQVERWGNVGGITAFSIGTYSCNVGTCWLEWYRGDNRHPVIGGNMLRLKDGRFEQLGQSWLKHGFFALAEELCSTDCIDPRDGGDHLGVSCADPYSASLNGRQDRLGPKWEVDVSTGVHPHPATGQALTGDAIFKRLQVHDVDLDPAVNAGARYFVEGQYVSRDDRAAGNHLDNASWREVLVEEAAGEYDIQLVGETHRTEPAIYAWTFHEAGVDLQAVDLPDGGRFWVGALAWDLGDSFWAYEYAIQNLSSQRPARRLTVPLPPGATVRNVGFHDVDYHSGEPFDGTDWSDDGGAGGSLSWWTDDAATNPNANALRWGTLYNFRFETDVPPDRAGVRIGMFDPSAPDAVIVVTTAPRRCNDNGTCESFEDCTSCAADCPTVGPDGDGDGTPICSDCDDTDPGAWAPPGEATDLRLRRTGRIGAVLTWQPPADPGATTLRHEILRSERPSDFVTAITCRPNGSPFGTADMDAPPARGCFHYLVRAANPCGAEGVGPVGADSLGVPRRAAGACQ
jgi:hypothetical protein